MAAKEIRTIDRQNAIKILQRIKLLSGNPIPQGCKKLKGNQDPYRVRQGDWRIIYSIGSDRVSILVLKIGHRKSVYR